MHGVKRAPQTTEAREARKRKEQAKLQEYLKLNDDVLARKKAKNWSHESLDLTTRLLSMNPEFYTVWNYRRDILTNGIFFECTPNDVNDILNTDLDMTMTFLRLHPKVYWIWNHRRWCLEHVPDGPEDNPIGWKAQHWAMELRAVDKMLDADARNFHAWNYRRYVLASMPVKKPELDELAYTTRKIEANFSNFSAWHQRSKVYSSMWEKGLLDETKSKDEEFELVKQALYVDPHDQSAWIYHRWLVGNGDSKVLLVREIAVIEELSDLEPDCKWCLESLVHYKRLLLRKHFSNITDPERQKILEECLCTLATLENIDPPRLKRYEEIAPHEQELEPQLALLTGVSTFCKPDKTKSAHKPGGKVATPTTKGTHGKHDDSEKSEDV
ncbi:rab-protein geranylgeranyltransferase [Phellopilus nigrolimitatus]|nr:rab-protein geranylgeranyltransferase [Phellopilus nigrolimitatus]